jgi:hypothetical protein
MALEPTPYSLRGAARGRSATECHAIRASVVALSCPLRSQRDCHLRRAGDTREGDTGGRAGASPHQDAHGAEVNDGEPVSGTPASPCLK